MKKPIEQIKPNPHRNFDIYPVGEAQVNLLIESISEVGMFLGLPARKVGDYYEIACGHHRLEALKRTGATHIDIAVNNYSDEDMLKIMIRENSTQRGNENFGAVLDSVGAVLVQCVRDVCESFGENSGRSRSEGSLVGNLISGRGIGVDNIIAKEPSFPEQSVKAALRTFRSTGVYLSLLKKGGLPEEFWHLYEKEKPITTIEAVAMFPKPAHAAAWVKGIKESERFQEITDIDNHIEIVSSIVSPATSNNQPLSVSLIKDKIINMGKSNLGDKDPVTPTTEKTLQDKADDIVKGIKSLRKKIMTFKPEKEMSKEDIYIEDMESLIKILIDDLEWFKGIRDEQTIIDMEK